VGMQLIYRSARLFACVDRTRRHRCMKA